MIGLESRDAAKGIAPRAAITRRRRSKDLSLYLLAVPGVIFFLIFSYAPMFGIIIAFKKFD